MNVIEFIPQEKGADCCGRKGDYSGGSFSFTDGSSKLICFDCVLKWLSEYRSCAESISRGLVS